jgi:hypothetical protein
MIIALLWLTGTAFKAFDQSEQLVVNLTSPHATGFLSFNNPKGSVRITGYNGEVILATAVLRSGSDASNKSTGMHRIEQKAFDITADEKNNYVSLVCLSNNKTVDFDIKIPRKFSLKISSFDNGKIEIINVEGDIEATNPNGDIILENVAGSAVINSVNGNVKAFFSAVKEGSPMMFTSLEGNIELYLPEKINANIKMRSQNGHLYSEFNIKPARHQTEVTKNEKGNVFSLEDWSVGAINKGGFEYILSTFNGNIYLKKSRLKM